MEDLPGTAARMQQPATATGKSKTSYRPVFSGRVQHGAYEAIVLTVGGKQCYTEKKKKSGEEVDWYTLRYKTGPLDGSTTDKYAVNGKELTQLRVSEQGTQKQVRCECMGLKDCVDETCVDGYIWRKLEKTIHTTSPTTTESPEGELPTLSTIQEKEAAQKENFVEQRKKQFSNIMESLTAMPFTEDAQRQCKAWFLAEMEIAKTSGEKPEKWSDVVKRWNGELRPVSVEELTHTHRQIKARADAYIAEIEQHKQTNEKQNTKIGAMSKFIRAARDAFGVREIDGKQKAHAQRTPLKLWVKTVATVKKVTVNGEQIKKTYKDYHKPLYQEWNALIKSCPELTKEEEKTRYSQTKEEANQWFNKFMKGVFNSKQWTDQAYAKTTAMAWKNKHIEYNDETEVKRRGIVTKVSAKAKNDDETFCGDGLQFDYELTFNDNETLVVGHAGCLVLLCPKCNGKGETGARKTRCDMCNPNHHRGYAEPKVFRERKQNLLTYFKDSKSTEMTKRMGNIRRSNIDGARITLPKGHYEADQTGIVIGAEIKGNGNTQKDSLIIGLDNKKSATVGRDYLVRHTEDLSKLPKELQDFAHELGLAETTEEKVVGHKCKITLKRGGVTVVNGEKRRFKYRAFDHTLICYTTSNTESKRKPMEKICLDDVEYRRLIKLGNKKFQLTMKPKDDSTVTYTFTGCSGGDVRKVAEDIRLKLGEIYLDKQSTTGLKQSTKPATRKRAQSLGGSPTRSMPEAARPRSYSVGSPRPTASQEEDVHVEEADCFGKKLEWTTKKLAEYVRSQNWSGSANHAYTIVANRMDGTQLLKLVLTSKQAIKDAGFGNPNSLAQKVLNVSSNGEVDTRRVDNFIKIVEETKPSPSVVDRRRRLASRRRRLENRPIHRLLREIRRAQA